VTACNANGGSLVTGQSLAAQNAITDQLRTTQTVGYKEALTYMGGDLTYSIRFEPDPNKKCQNLPSVVVSVNCIYRWNLGLFASGEFVGKGVPFYRGSLYSLPGAGPLNEYTPFWEYHYPAHGETYVVSWFTLRTGTQATWYDGPVTPVGNNILPYNYFLVVCEVQDSIIGSTTTTTPIPTPIPTTAPTTTPPQAASEPSWIKKHWYVPLIIALVVLAAIIGLIVLCCCLGGRDEGKYLPPMVTREASDMPLRAREITDDDDDYYNDGNDNRSMSMVPSEPMPMEDIESANV
ncbi:uncharacterized protein TM35_000401370, partial [Trypanosoma theileri]